MLSLQKTIFNRMHYYYTSLLTTVTTQENVKNECLNLDSREREIHIEKLR